MLTGKGNKEKEVKKELKEYEQSKPLQLGLFEVDDQNKEKYSNTIDLYDQMPKYYFGGVEREKGKTVESLPILSREFKHIKQDYKLTISPAAILNEQGKTIHYYPSQREELIEDALRRIAASKKKGIYLDNDSAVKFTLYELQQELKRMGHGYAINQIKEGIEICNKSILQIKSKQGNEISITSSMFPFVGMETSNEIEGGKNRVVIMFHPLVTKSINEGTFRLINYEKVMSYKMALSRYLHKRISHNFIQASEHNPYTPNLNTIVRDSGMKEYAKKNQTLKQVCKSLDELVKFNTLSKYEVEKVSRGKNIIDANLKLYISDEFVAEIKKANKAKNKELEYTASDEFIKKIEEIRKELEKPIYGLSKVVILNILSKIINKDEVTILEAALEYTKREIEKGLVENPAAFTKAAIKEGWASPKKDSKEEGQIELLHTTKEAIVIKNEDSLWKNLIKILKNNFEKEIFDRWFSKLNFINFKDGEIVLGVESKFLRDWITREYNNLLLGTFQKVDNSISRISIKYLEELNLEK